MFHIVSFFRGLFRTVGRPFVVLKDRLRNVEVNRKLGENTPWAKRDPITYHDIEAPRVNANVYIATRAISDAIMGLPVNVISAEVIGGVEREIDDNDHEANIIFQDPNPEHSWSEIVQHIAKSYLNDGNAMLTIERMTGPNNRVELWPRDPRYVDISADKSYYRFGAYTNADKTYRRNQVIHIRDYDPADPWWGRGRIQSVRDEIAMDYYANAFNSGFFKNGALFGLMFTPDHDLSEDQHKEIIDAMIADIGGVEKAFGIFINRFAGKLENPGMKHKDIAFGELIRMNREKIFGVYGLPPFRGGVMEYSNYANALAQDLDFWRNTIAPILKIIEGAFNKQLLRPMYGANIRMKFDLDSVPAIQGDKNEQIERLGKLIDKKIVSAKWAREQLDIPEEAAPEEPDPAEETPADDENQPTNEERNAVENALYRIFKLQHNETITNLRKMTSNGRMMATLCAPDKQAKDAYDYLKAASTLRATLLPITRNMLTERGVARSVALHLGAFNPNGEKTLVTNSVKLQIERIVEQMVELIASTLVDVDKYNMTLWQLERRIKTVFSLQRAHDFSNTMMSELIPQINLAINDNLKNGATNTPCSIVN